MIDLIVSVSNTSWNEDASLPIRGWTHAVTELAYETVRRNCVQLRRNHRIIRLDGIHTNIVAHRALPGSLFRVGLAVVDLLAMHIDTNGLSFIVVDEVKGLARVVGFEIGADKKLCKRRYAITSSILLIYSV